VREGISEKQVETLPIKKRINTEIFIDRTSALLASLMLWSESECIVVSARGAKEQNMWERETMTTACFKMTLTGM